MNREPSLINVLGRDWYLKLSLVVRDCDWIVEVYEHTGYLSGKTFNYLNIEYNRTYSWGKKGIDNPARGVRILEGESELSSCLVTSSGGASWLGCDSCAVHGKYLYITVGNRVFSLLLPELQLGWTQVVDMASCFGVRVVNETQCIIANGECEISRLDFNGELVWQVVGKDVFMRPLALDRGYIIVKDFQRCQYRISIEDGSVEIDSSVS